VIFHTEKLESLEAAIGKDENGSDTTINLANCASKDNYDVPSHTLGVAEPAVPIEGEYTAREIKNRLIAYRDELLSYAKEGSSLANSLNATFNFDDKADASGTINNWESYNFYHTPLAATLTILSSIQSDVRNAESDLVKQLFANVDASSFKFNVVEAAVIPTSNYVLLGDTFRASVFIAAYDDTKNPIIKVGTEIDSTTWAVSGDTVPVEVVAGKGNLKIKSTSEGEFTWKGAIQMKAPTGELMSYPFSTTYTVAKASLVVSADKMNVFYKGVENPVSVSVPGFAPDKVKASISTGSMVSKGKGHYIVKVKKGIKATISVVVTMPDGSTKRMGQGVVFRLKNIPDPVPYVAQKTGTTIMSKARLGAASKVTAKMDNFDFDLKVNVKSFVFSTTISGALLEEKVKGNRIPDKIKKIISKSKRNTKVYFESIEVKMPDGTTRNLGPISFKLQ
jgi:gliding motility-associated protein GldM